MKNHGYRAQAMLEFALTLMLLLVVVIGLLEVGRLIFMYSSIITAGREAVRYGSAAGINDAGNLYYQDCDGIRNAARRAAFLMNLEDSDIVIQYDDFADGLGAPFVPYCTPGTSVDNTVELNSCDRILVAVTASYNPVVNIIPITQKNLVGSTSRTIMGIIELGEPTPTCN